METPKALEQGESTYRNDGAMCGGVMSKTEFFKNVEANMMAYYMDDENFEMYKRLKKGGTADQKAASELFRLKARSFI